MALAAPVLAGGDSGSQARPVVIVAPSKASIIIGTISLRMAPFVWKGGGYVSTYSARVFPYFLFNEHGMIVIGATDDQFRRLGRGETISDAGRAVNSDGAQRRIECRITPVDKTHGGIRVRITVAPGFGLTFNTTYTLLD